MLDVIWNPESCDVDKTILGEEMASYQRSMLGSNHGFWDWNLSTNRMRWYGTFWRELGYDERDAQRMTTPEILLDFIHPDDRQGFRLAIEETIKKGSPLDYCYRLQSKRGDYLWVRVNGQGYRDESGWTYYMAGVNYDISELKRTEEALRASEARHSRMIAGTRDGVWEWDLSTDEVSFTDICWEQLGFTPQEVREFQLYRIEDWKARMSDRDIQRFDQALRRHIIDRVPFDVEYQVTAKDGSLRWIRARAEATYNEHGRAVRISGSNMDTTELKSTQEALLEAKTSAEKANQAKSEFLSSMSHELRTPLNAILGYSQLLTYDANLSGGSRDNVDEIHRAGKHLLQLINEVLDLAKIEAGHMSLTLDSVVPSRLVTECLRLMAPLADDHQIQLHCQLNALESVAVEADFTRLKQVFLNLVSNAIKYNRPGGRVDVSFHATDRNTLRILVEDTGVGIPKNRLDQVFEPFSRLHEHSAHVEGSGVGLVITRQLINMMNGHLDFTSVEGQGSGFWFELPLAETSASERPSRTLEEEVGVLEVEDHHRILYIEDNPANAKLLAKIVERFKPLELDIAAEPMLGIYQARTQLPDLILLDINLPDMDGFEVLKVLKRDPATCDIPVVALSANALASDIDRGYRSGFSGYLTKPIEVGQLVRVFNRVLGECELEWDD
ncbi:PAS domain-containing protein [Marinimicrobium agarilyticum]|uniref:PAS domain-containing protein n=1 Tax=Marinimicrobium agarilyticum TaxID=306546 RepID=UPI00040C8DBC|nr:PAS domain-containing protein [Marinimicrobium agarilyticum]